MKFVTDIHFEIYLLVLLLIIVISGCHNIYYDMNERSNSRETDSMGIIIYIGRVSRYLEEEYYRRFEK